MKLSVVERMILANQYHILEGLYPQQARSFKEAREALEQGYEAHYDHAQHMMPGHSGEEAVMTTEECEEVQNILYMFSVLQSSYLKLPDQAGITPTDLEFSGFDGNNETKWMAYTLYFCTSDGGRYADLNRADDFNSHRPMLTKYRHMVREWGRSADKDLLTKEDLQRIVTEVDNTSPVVGPYSLERP